MDDARKRAEAIVEAWMRGPGTPDLPTHIAAAIREGKE